jgi:hypothetical protein
MQLIRIGSKISGKIGISTAEKGTEPLVNETRFFLFKKTDGLQALPIKLASATNFHLPFTALCIRICNLSQ